MKIITVTSLIFNKLGVTNHQSSCDAQLEVIFFKHGMHTEHSESKEFYSIV